MTDSIQEDLERFVTEDIGMQIANLRYHLVNSPNHYEGDGPAITGESLRKIDAVLESLLNKVRSLQEEMLPRVERDCRNFAQSTVVSLRGKGQPNPAEDKGISSVLSRFNLP